MDRNDIKNLILIFIIFIAACIETDIFLPALTDMMAFFSASESQIQSLLTWNFFGICISGPLYGPISDSIGRKKPLMVALGLFLAGSVVTLFGQTFNQMLIGRLLQGFGSGGCFTLGTAILFDAFQEKKAVQALNQLNSTVPFVMALAPMLGGYLNHMFGFRSNFLAIGLFALLSFGISLFLFNETLEQNKRQPLKPSKLWNDFKIACTCVPFWQVTLIISLIFAGYLAFLSVSAVLFIVELGISKQLFPFFQASILGAWLIASISCNKAMNSLGPQLFKKIGTILTVSGGTCFAITGLITPENPLLLTFGMLFFAFGANWVQTLYFPEGMEILPDIKGMTSSLLTSARLLITALVVGLTSHFYNATIYPLVIMISLVIATILPLILLYEKNHSKNVTATTAVSMH